MVDSIEFFIKLFEGNNLILIAFISPCGILFKQWNIIATHILNSYIRTKYRSKQSPLFPWGTKNWICW
jgi:hypothetical protein